MTEIIPGLYLGSSLHARDLEWLSENQITHVLNMTKEIPISFPEEFEYKRVPAVDCETFKMSKFFPEIVEFIGSGLQTGRVLVHCMMGISRSATAVILFLIANRGMKSSVARQYVKQKCPLICPNKAFVTQIINYELLYCKKVTQKPTLASKHRQIRGGSRSPRTTTLNAQELRESRGGQLLEVMKAFMSDISQATMQPKSSHTPLINLSKATKLTPKEEDCMKKGDKLCKKGMYSRALSSKGTVSNVKQGLAKGASMVEFDKIFNKLLKRTRVPCSPDRLERQDKGSTRESLQKHRSMKSNLAVSQEGGGINMLAAQSQSEKNKLEGSQSKLFKDWHQNRNSSGHTIKQNLTLSNRMPLKRTNFRDRSMSSSSFKQEPHKKYQTPSKQDSKVQVNLSTNLTKKRVSSISARSGISQSSPKQQKLYSHAVYNIYSRSNQKDRTTKKGLSREISPTKQATQSNESKGGKICASNLDLTKPKVVSNRSKDSLGPGGFSGSPTQKPAK